jgi:hypothetical protein
MTQFAGIDVGQGHTYSCVLDIESSTFHYPEQQLSLLATITWLQSFKKLKGACIDGPPNPNTGALARRLPLQTIHNTDRRLTEFQIGIGGCYSTRAAPPQQGATNFWMQSAFDLFQLLSAEFEWGINRGGGDGQLIETHPTYAFKALLGCNRHEVYGIQRHRLDPQSALRRKHSREGRQQRIELLTALCGEIGLEIGDNLLHKWNQRIDWVDAAICAFMSYWQQSGHAQLESPGDPFEGAIFLWIPSGAFAVTAYDERRRDARGVAALPAVPVRLLDGVPTPANAVILRLGDTRELNQLDTIDTILTSDDLEEFWIPCGSNAMPQLCRNLHLVGGRLFLSWGTNLRVALNVNECRQDDNPLPYPADTANPWPLAECRRWLRISESAEIDSEQFFVNQQGVWTQGFGGGQTALLWAVVPENGGQN